jgi:hypothetical protein
MKVRNSGAPRGPVRMGLVGGVAVALLVGTVAPGHTSETPTGTGTSTLSITPASLDIDGLPAQLDAALGTLVADATNTADPVARLALASLSGVGQHAPEAAFSSADGDARGNETRTVGAGGLSATVELVDYLVQADADSAVAELSALAGEIDTPVGLGADVGAQGVHVSARPTGTASSAVVQVSGLTFGLGDLLPADVLDALPLSAVLDLVDTLDLPLSGTVLDQVADVDTLLVALTDAVEQAETLADLQAQVDSAASDLPETAAVADAEQALATAEAAVQALEDEAARLAADIAAVEAEIADLEAELATLDPVLDALRIMEIEEELAVLETELTVLETELGAIETTELPAARADVEEALVVLADAQAALEAALIELGLEDLIAELALVEDLLGDLLDRLAVLLDGLDLSTLLDALLEGLTDTPLFDLGSIELTLGTLADGTSSAGTVTCTATGLRVLGADVATPGCDAVGAALDSLAGTIGDALSVLPVAAPVPAVTAGGLETSSSGAGAPDADGVTSAFARVSALTLQIAPVDLVATTDDLVAELEGLLGELVALLPGLDVGDVISLQGTDHAVGSLALDVPLTLEGDLTELRGVLALLPTGGALDGLRTLGLGAVLGAVDLESSFTAAAAPATPTPASPAPADPTETSPGELPVTGADQIHVLLAAALAALAAGGTFLGLGRGLTMGVLTLPRRGADGFRRVLRST